MLRSPDSGVPIWLVADVTENELRELIERQHLLHELSRHEGWPIYVDYIVDQMAKKQRRLLSGQLEDMEGYKFEAGYLAGAQYALDAERNIEAMVARAREMLELVATA